MQSWNFGDIAFSGSTIHGIGATGSNRESFSINMNNFQVNKIGNLSLNNTLQLAFAGVELIGLNPVNLNVYRVNTSTGALAYVSTVNSATGGTLRINDLSSFTGELTVVPESTTLVPAVLGGIGMLGYFRYKRA